MAGETAIDGDGNVWFVELRTNRLGVLYPALGRFDEALLPAVRSLPSAITVDGTGKIWFLEYLENKIGLFLPKEARFMEFVIPTPSSLPGSIAFDATRGLLWFSETNTEAKALGMLDIKLLDKAGAGAGDVRTMFKEKSASSAGGIQNIILALGGALGLLLVVFFIAKRRRKGRA